MSGAMNRQLYSRINYVHSSDGGTSLRECPGIIKTMHTGLARTRFIMPTPSVLTEETDVGGFSGKTV